MENLACKKVTIFITSQSFTEFLHKYCSSLISGEIICAICTHHGLRCGHNGTNKNSNSGK